MSLGSPTAVRVLVNPSASISGYSTSMDGSLPLKYFLLSLMLRLSMLTMSTAVSLSGNRAMLFPFK